MKSVIRDILVTLLVVLIFIALVPIMFVCAFTTKEKSNKIQKWLTEKLTPLANYISEMTKAK